MVPLFKKRIVGFVLATVRTTVKSVLKNCEDNPSDAKALTASMAFGETTYKGTPELCAAANNPFNCLIQLLVLKSKACTSTALSWLNTTEVESSPETPISEKPLIGGSAFPLRTT